MESLLGLRETRQIVSEAKKETILAVLQPGYLPWLGFFDQMERADVFIIYDDVQYDKNGWRNRNRIKTHSGPQWLSVPVHVKLGQPINTVSIDNSKNWAKKHLTSIRQMYKTAPHFAAYMPELEKILEQRWERIIDLDLALIKQMGQWLGIKTPVKLSSALKVEGDRNERLINFCRHEKANHYFSGNAAKVYLDVEAFKLAGIEVSFQEYKHPSYPQLHGEFIPYLSTLDLLMNCGNTSLAIIKQCNSRDK